MLHEQCSLSTSGIVAKVTENGAKKKIQNYKDLESLCGKLTPIPNAKAKNNTANSGGGNSNKTNKRRAPDQDTSPINKAHSSKSSKAK